MITNEMESLAGLLASLRRQRREIEREEKAVEQALMEKLMNAGYVDDGVMIGDVQYVVRRKFRSDICTELIRRGLWHCMSMQPKPAEIFKAADMGKIGKDVIDMFAYTQRYFVVKGNGAENGG